jgi:hypothetical protein
MSARDEIRVSALNIEDLTPAEREAVAEAGQKVIDILDDNAE